MFNIAQAAAWPFRRLRPTTTGRPVEGAMTRPAATPTLLIQPRPGPWAEIASEPGPMIIATRDNVSGNPDPATRSFIGALDELAIGSVFDSRHASNGRPCGEWTVRAIIQHGTVIGTRPAQRKIQLNRIINS